jgi:hypothetical protein
MWLGSGGVIAIFACVWGCVWAFRARRDARWWRRPATPVAFPAVMVSATLISLSTTLVVPTGELSRSLSEDKKAAVHALMTYDPMWSTAAAVLCFCLAMAWGARRLEPMEPEGRAWLNALASGAMVISTLVSAGLFTVFHVVFMARDPALMSVGAGANATRALIFTGAFAWVGLLVALGWGLLCGVTVVRQRRSG